MKSIRSKLVTTLSITITGLVLSILVATDIAVDSWIDNEFNRGLKSKAGMLMSLIDIDEEEIDFDFSGNLCLSFLAVQKPEYFQIWSQSGVFARSESLIFSHKRILPLEKIKLGETKIINTELPDGRNGRVIYTRFIPPLDLDDDEDFIEGVNTSLQQPITLAYAASSEEVDFVLWLIDVIFVVSTVSVIVFIRLFVRKSVDSSLAPLNKLNRDISRLSIADKNAVITIKEPVKELQPIVDSLNAFIKKTASFIFVKDA